jgi:hypothetical protein
MCIALLPPGGYPIAVKKYIIYHIIYGHIYSLDSFDHTPFFKITYNCPFYPAAWVKRPFGIVSENLKFQVTNIVDILKTMRRSIVIPATTSVYFVLLKATKV